MTPLALRLLASVHGQLAVLSVALLVHAAVWTRTGRAPRGRGVAIALAGLLPLSTYGLGIVLYPSYRSEVKRPLYAVSELAGRLFETKEHLALAVVTLALGSCVASLSSPADEVSLRRAASAGFGLAATLGFVVGGLGVYVSALRDFPVP